MTTYQTNPLIVPVVDTNLLSLDTWRYKIGWNPWHFWGLTNQKVPVQSGCNTIVRKYTWQSADAGGRDDVIRSIQDAEEKLMPYMGYYPAPKYLEQELPWPRYPKQDVIRLGYAGGDGRWLTVTLPNKHIIGIGTEALDLIQNVPVNYLDNDKDGLYDTFQVSFETSTGGVSVPKEIALYFQPEDREGEDPGEKWRIRPIKTKIDPVSGMTTVTGKAWLMVKPGLYDGMGNSAINSQGLDPSDDATYVTDIDIYHHYLYQDGKDYLSSQAVLVWESPPYPQWAALFNLPAPEGLDPAGAAFAVARVTIRDADQGIVGVGEATYDSQNQVWTAIPWYASAYKFRPPDRVIIRYLAGAPTDPYGEMQDSQANIVKNFSAALLTRPICACSATGAGNRELATLQDDMSATAGVVGGVFGAYPRDRLNNPLGSTRRGAIMAWTAIKGVRQLKGYSPG